MNLGYNDSSSTQSLKNFLVPSLPEVIFLVLISIIVLMALSHNAVWVAASADAGVNAEVASVAAQPQLQAIADFFSQELFAKVTVFLLWGCIGAVAYTTIGALQHFASNVNKDVKASKYVQPKASNNYWASRVAQYLYVLAISFLLVMFVAVLVSAILPLCVTWMSTTILQYDDVTQYGYALAAVGLTASCFFILLRLCRAVVYSFHVTFGN